jgi:TRAP-type C4-dicarboxylate transport system substrate-binding protein
MKKFLLILLTVTLMSTLIFSFSACEEEVVPPANGGEEEMEPVTLRLATTLPPEDPAVLAVQDMASRFNERADGQYIMEVYAGGTLASMEETFPMLSTGAIDIAEASIEYQSGSDVRFGAVTLPFLLNSFDANVKFLELINESLFNDIIAEKFNAMPFIVAACGFHDYFGVDKPIETLEDWEGSLVWVASPTESDTISALGASPVTIPLYDGYPSMEKGVVDSGVALAPLGLAIFGFGEILSHITVAHMFGTSIYYYINLDTFNSMPSDIQTILLEERQRTETEIRELMRQMDNDALANLENAGVEVYYLPETERARWIEASSSVIDDFFEQIGEADAQTIINAAEEANQ